MKLEKDSTRNCKSAQSGENIFNGLFSRQVNLLC